MKNRSSHFHDLLRLKQHQGRLSYLPARGKQPRQVDWPNQPGMNIDDFFNYPGSNSVGVRTGTQHGPLAIFDIDGESALKLSCDCGMKPSEWITWQIHRKEAPNRLKLLCIPTPEQIQQLERSSFIATVKTKPPIKDGQGNLIQKGEGLEFFFGSKQGIVWGIHPDGGRYLWPEAANQPFGIAAFDAGSRGEDGFRHKTTMALRPMGSFFEFFLQLASLKGGSGLKFLFLVQFG